MWAHILRRGRRCIWLSTFIREIASQNINSAPDIHGSFSQHWNFTNKILGWYHIMLYTFWRTLMHISVFKLRKVFLFGFQNHYCHSCDLRGRNWKDEIGFPATAPLNKYFSSETFFKKISWWKLFSPNFLMEVSQWKFLDENFQRLLILSCELRMLAPLWALGFNKFTGNFTTYLWGEICRKFCVPQNLYFDLFYFLFSFGTSFQSFAISFPFSIRRSFQSSSFSFHEKLFSQSMTLLN